MSSHIGEHIMTIEIDFVKPAPDIKFPEEIDVAYYLIHSPWQVFPSILRGRPKKVTCR